MVLAKLCHSLHEVLHNQVHICTGGVSSHTQPQGVLCYVAGDPAAEQNRGGPETNVGMSGFNLKTKKTHHQTASQSPNKDHSCTDALQENHLFSKGICTTQLVSLWQIWLFSSKKEAPQCSHGLATLDGIAVDQHKMTFCPHWDSPLGTQHGLEWMSQTHTDMR